MATDFTAELGNHLWQSTVFAAAAGLLTLALRKNRASLRYWVWLAASVKFVVPFVLLISLGAKLELPHAAGVTPGVQASFDQISQPFVNPASSVVTPAPAAPSAALLMAVGVWLLGAVCILGLWCARWWCVRRAVRAAAPLMMGAPIPVLSAPGALEPGVFGIFRPVLLLPAGIVQRLTSAQLGAILAHELCHVRRRDNLVAAFQMLVEAVFWFHPLVWLIGRRLVEERERACDEEVLRLGSRARTYAEGILNVCKFYVESPVTCVSGVTGADLKKRIEAIMANRATQRLTLSRKVLLAAAGTAALALPLIVGILKPHSLRAQTGKTDQLKFEVASVRPARSGEPNSRLGPIPGGGLQAKNVTLESLITFAYDVREFQVSGGPGWVRSDRFDILAKPELPDGPSELKGMTPVQHDQLIEHLRERTRLLLAERFQLAIRQGTKELPVFALVTAKSGHKLKPTTGSNQHMRTGRMQLQADGSTIAMLANSLSMLVGRKVVDQTGISGGYDFELNWTRDSGATLPGRSGAPDESAPADAPGSISIFTALQEQLGLKLEAQKGPVETIVIERVERPTEN